MRVPLFLAVVAILLTTTPAQAGERLLAPVDDWRVEAMDESCALIRNFKGPNGDKLRLQMLQFGLAEEFRIVMIGEALPLRGGKRGVAQFRFRFKPDRQWRKAFGTTGYVNGVDALVFAADLATSAEAKRLSRDDGRDAMVEDLERGRDPARAAEVEEFALAYPARDDTVLQIGSMAQPLMQLRKCNSDRLRKLGYDPARIAGFQKWPSLANGKETVGAILRRMLRGKLGHNEPIFLRMDIDEQGRAIGCKIQHPDRGTEVEEAICHTLRDVARFEPAADQAGNPVAAPYFTSVIFGL